MFDKPDLPELEEAALALMASLLQHENSKSEVKDQELSRIYDELFNDLTIDDLQWLVMIFASLSVDMLSGWAKATTTDSHQLLSKIALVKAVERMDWEA